MSRVSKKKKDAIYAVIEGEIMRLRINRNLGGIADIDKALFDMTLKIHKRLELVLES